MTVFAEVLGRSPAIVAVRTQFERLLRHSADTRRLPPILIQGETGTGKGLLARAIHRAGSRRDGPFIDVNCAAIPENLLESEMFGFERGAFTDARQPRVGLLQAAHRGMIFLDEIGLLPEALQAKLLKAIEDRAVRRLGSTRSEPVDVWIVAATSEDLGDAIQARRFREDLYHRLAVLTVRLPPLRDRTDDIVVLAEHHLARACEDYGLPTRQLDAGARRALLAYRWPGNVRELANVMERVALLSEGIVVTAEMLGLGAPSAGESREAPHHDRPAPLEDEVDHLERTRIVEALERERWNVSRAAKFLQMSRNKLRYRIEHYELRRQRPLAIRPRQRASSRPEPPTPVSAVATGAPSLHRERRRLTFLRGDLVDPSEARPPLDSTRLVQRFVDKVQGFGGHVEERGPRGIVAVFGLEPVEDAPWRAALSAMAMLKAVEAARETGGGGFRLKLGVHIDRVAVGRGDSAVQLEGEGKAAVWSLLDAILAAGDTETIVASAAAVPFLERRFDLVPTEALDGAPVRVHRLVSQKHLGPGLWGRLARLIGRNAELDLLRNRLEAAMAGRGQAVGIVGEPGIGKSHLLHEFQQSLADRDVTYLEGRCFSYTTAIPYVPVIETLRTSCGVSETDDSGTVIDKVRRSLERLAMPPDESAPFLLHLLGIKHGADRLIALSPDAIKARTFEIFSNMILNGSRLRPLVLAVEDLHWIDAASEAYLVALIEGITGLPVLLLMTYRPGSRPPGAETSYFTQMALPPLSQEDSLKVVQSVPETEQMPEHLARVILTRAEGNPFFLQELARWIGDRRDPLPPAVPDTLEEVLLARMERLSGDGRRLLQVASVLGREFPLRLLRAMWDAAATLDPLLRDLTQREFLMLRRAVQEPVCLFKHALMQEVAYHHVPRPEREALHAAAGRAIEHLYEERLEEVYDRLAYHFARTDEAGKAIDYLSRFAAKAARASAHVEAVAALEETLPHVEHLPPGAERGRRRIGVVLQRVHSLTFLGRFQEALDLLVGERERVEQLGDPALTGPYYFWLGRTYGVIGDHERAVESAQRALVEATRNGDTATMGKAYYALAYEDYWSGQARAGVELGRRAVSLLGETDDRMWLGLAHWVVAINCAHTGNYAAALEAVGHVREIGEAIGDPGLRCTALWTSGMIDTARGEHGAGIAACERALESSPGPVNRALAMGFLGGSHLANGDAARAIPLLEEAARCLGQFRVRTQGWFLALLGEAYLMGGQPEHATASADEGLRVSRDARYRYGLGWAQRALGRIALAQRSFAEAEAHLGDALHTFDSVEARSEEGRTHLTLAELAQARSDRDRTAQHLSEASRLFKSLAITRYVERTEESGRKWGIGPLAT